MEWKAGAPRPGDGEGLGHWGSVQGCEGLCPLTSVPFWPLCLHLGTLIGPWGVDREPLRLRPRRHWVMLAPHASSSARRAQPLSALRWGGAGGREVGDSVRGGGDVCASVCLHCPSVSVATPATPAPFPPRPIRAPLSSEHTGVLLLLSHQSQRRGVGPLHRGRTDTYQGYLPTFSTLHYHGSCQF